MTCSKQLASRSFSTVATHCQMLQLAAWWLKTFALPHDAETHPARLGSGRKRCFIPKLLRTKDHDVWVHLCEEKFLVVGQDDTHGLAMTTIHCVPKFNMPFLYHQRFLRFRFPPFRDVNANKVYHSKKHNVIPVQSLSEVPCAETSIESTVYERNEVTPYLYHAKLHTKNYHACEEKTYRLNKVRSARWIGVSQIFKVNAYFSRRGFLLTRILKFYPSS
jgi:hypothetical protein